MTPRNKKNPPREQRRSAGSWAALALVLLAGSPASAQDGEGLTAEELELVDGLHRRGEDAEILELVDEVLAEAPDDAWAHVLRGEARFRRCDYDAALADLERGLALALAAPAGGLADPGAAARALADALVELGRPHDALAALERAGAAVDPAGDSRDAWARGAALSEAGRREDAHAAWRAGADAKGPRTWRGLLARARCERALGFFERAARSLVEADRLAAEGHGAEPDVLAELGDVYLEVYGEVADAMTTLHLPSRQYEEALSIDPDHEEARLGLVAVYRLNWALHRETPVDLLGRALEARPASVPALVACVSTELDDGRLLHAREALERLEAIAPRRRDVRAERAALAWIEHDRDGARALLEELAAEDARDAAPERTVARHLNEIYRFPEALPFAEAATARDPQDWLAWDEYARALANVGREDEARAAFARAEDAAEGRRNAWRANTSRVLAAMERDYVERAAGDHTFVWMPDAAEILDVYLVPFYARHREGLAKRYGHTPGPVRIEVFRRWDDFSVRSTGFTGFSALGVCFGPVVTSVSPLSELRGSFSWARTAYHEYTHVIHLSLSHNRCPRWITEGLATWEEEVANPAWSRNMRLDLLNAHANDDLIPVRDLNRAFRTPRILFAYYQGGLLCRMLIDDVGFPPMVRLLTAFDRGLDLDEAFGEVLGKTPEQVDLEFRAFVGAMVAPLAIEPGWSPARVLKTRLALRPTPPDDAAQRARWIDDWLTVGWGSLQQGRRVDAEEALRRVKDVAAAVPRYHFLRAQLATTRGDAGLAREAFERGLAEGGEDFRARVALARIAASEGETEVAEAHLLAAERAFPGIPEPMPPAELELADLYQREGDVDRAMEARRRWLAWNAGDFDVRMQVAAWLEQGGRHADAERLYAEANEVDPFARALHARWGRALAALGRHEEALRELEVALRVPPELDRDLGPKPPEMPEDAYADRRARWDADRAEILARQARALAALGRAQDARARAEEALALDEDQEIAREVLGEL